MKVVRRSDTQEVQATAPIFIGTVYATNLVDKKTSEQVTVTLVRFEAGGRNKWHTHGADQVLYVTEGRGIVATREQEHEIATGDIVHVPTGEVHWHGGTAHSGMAHLSILPPCKTEIVED